MMHIAHCLAEKKNKKIKYLTTLISATSDKPPTENRKNFRFNARAIERPILVLPTPGGPERQIIFPAMCLQ